MQRTFAVITDIHIGPQGGIAYRRNDLGLGLLRRAIDLLNTRIKPDALLLLGDTIDRPHSAETVSELAAVREALSAARFPWVAIPGNHDPRPEVFFELMPRPADRVELAGVRVLPFTDPEAPRYNAVRSEANLARSRLARDDGFTGPVIAIQHVPLWPFDEDRVWYRYVNRDDAVRAVEEGGIDVCMSGHCHAANGPLVHGNCAYLTVPSLCEAPFPFLILKLDGRSASARFEHLSPQV